MSTSESKPNETPDEFLSRWSRRKLEARVAEAEKPLVQPVASDKEAVPVLPPLEELGKDSDYRGFLHPKVDERLRRAALKKLFSDPHFNIMDGLDTYIDDYSINEPIPAAMLAELKQAQNILAWAKEDREAVAKREAAAAVAAQGDAAAEQQIADAAAVSEAVSAAPVEVSVAVPSRPEDDEPQNA